MKKIMSLWLTVTMLFSLCVFTASANNTGVYSSEVVDFAGELSKEVWTETAATVEKSAGGEYAEIKSNVAANANSEAALSYAFQTLPSLDGMEELVFEFDYKLLEAPKHTHIFSLMIGDKYVGRFNVRNNKVFGNSLIYPKDDLTAQGWYGASSPKDEDKGVSYPTADFVKLKMVVDLEERITTYYVGEEIIGTNDFSHVVESPITELTSAKFVVGVRNSASETSGTIAAIDNLKIYSREKVRVSEVVDFTSVVNESSWKSGTNYASSLEVNEEGGYGEIINTAMAGNAAEETLTYTFNTLPDIADMDELVFEFDYKMLAEPMVAQALSLRINGKYVGRFNATELDGTKKLFGNTKITVPAGQTGAQPWYGVESDRKQWYISYPKENPVKLKMVVDLANRTTTYYATEGPKEKVMGTYDFSHDIASSITNLDNVQFVVGVRVANATPYTPNGKFAAVDNLKIYSRMAPEEEFITGASTKFDYKHDFESAESQALITAEGTSIVTDADTDHSNVLKIDTGITAEATDTASANNLRYNERVSVYADFKMNEDGTANFILKGLNGKDVIKVGLDISSKKVNLTTTKNAIGPANDSIVNNETFACSYAMPEGIAAGEWFTMKIDYNIMSKTYSVYLNDKLVNDLPLIVQNLLDATQTTNTSFRGFSVEAVGADLYFDNFSVMRKNDADAVKVNAAFNAALVMYANDVYRTALTHGTQLKQYTIQNCGQADGKTYVHGSGVTLDNPGNYKFVEAADVNDNTPVLTYTLGNDPVTEIESANGITEKDFTITCTLGDYTETKTVTRKVAPVEINQISKTVTAFNAVRIAGAEPEKLYVASYTAENKMVGLCEGAKVEGADGLYQIKNIYAPGNTDEDENTISVVKIFAVDSNLVPLTSANVYR